jgi:hypothetical protein
LYQYKTYEVLSLQFEFGFAVLLLSPVVCSIMAFLRSLQAEEMAMTSKPRKVFTTYYAVIFYWDGKSVL